MRTAGTTHIKPIGTFRHGVHPEDRKEATCDLPIERMPFPEECILPLSQHIGAPARALVKPGERVERGQMVAGPGGFVSTAIHTPVTGTVTAIERRPHPSGKQMEAIVVRTDPMASQRDISAPPPPAADATPAELVRRIQEAGIVGLGGAAFPSHVKLQVPDDKKVEFVILNGCECEPYLTCDHRVMAERSDAVIRGMDIIAQLVGGKRSYIGIEVNKPDVIEALKARTTGRDDVEVVPLAVKYPEGAEKMLIEAILHREVPTGKIPLDLEIVVNNVGTAAAIADLMETGRPLIERVVTVTGPGIKRPANVLVPIGTPAKDVIAHCGGLTDDVRQVIFGGPMMGMAQKTLDVPVIKGTSGILVMTEDMPVYEEMPCIKCGRCVEACAMFLNPSRLAQLVRAERVDDLVANHMNSCFECASCSFVCPSRIPLVQLMRIGKSFVRERQKK